MQQYFSTKFVSYVISFEGFNMNINLMKVLN